MDDCGFGTEQHIHIWIGGKTVAKLFESLPHTIFIQPNKKMFFVWYTEHSINFQLKWTTEVSVLNDIIVSG